MKASAVHTTRSTCGPSMFNTQLMNTDATSCLRSLKRFQKTARTCCKNMFAQLSQACLLPPSLPQCDVTLQPWCNQAWPLNAALRCPREGLLNAVNRSTLRLTESLLTCCFSCSPCNYPPRSLPHLQEGTRRG